jgi:hypothetical protein
VQLLYSEITTFSFCQKNLKMKQSLILFISILGFTTAYTTPQTNQPSLSQSNQNRRGFLKTVSFLGIAGAASVTVAPEEAQAVGPVKLKLKVKNYSAKICPKDRPIPGEKAMKGMRGLCVTVNADVEDVSPKVRTLNLKQDAWCNLGLPHKHFSMIGS